MSWDDWWGYFIFMVWPLDKWIFFAPAYTGGTGGMDYWHYPFSFILLGISFPYAGASRCILYVVLAAATELCH